MEDYDSRGNRLTQALIIHLNGDWSGNVTWKEWLEGKRSETKDWPLLSCRSINPPRWLETEMKSSAENKHSFSEIVRIKYEI